MDPSTPETAGQGGAEKESTAVKNSNSGITGAQTTILLIVRGSILLWAGVLFRAGPVGRYIKKSGIP